ncbi:MAG: hypothetical protein HY318_03840 [Armatimonadetes bacterium]|nr:hypothetical protein [Armatimonadota bacterium]
MRAYGPSGMNMSLRGSLRAVRPGVQLLDEQVQKWQRSEKMRLCTAWLLGIGFIAGLLAKYMGGCGRADSSVATSFSDYIAREEPEFQWKQTDEKTIQNGRMIDLHLVSQVWQGIKWEHRLVVFLPQKVEFPGTAVLLNTGGDAGPLDRMLGMAAANGAGCVFAILYQIPNQPLFGDLTEDNLIAHTFVEFLKSDDATWPLLFPMVKSVVKALDALQAFGKEKLQQSIEGFVITGASKRGWTTWLTGAVDPRVKAIMPMVYDNLNIPAQMPHQLETWGEYSEQIEEYTRRGLQQQLSSDRGKKLVAMADPHSYLNKLTMPKLIVNGTNDRYWTLDSLNLYWKDLPGQNYVLYCPNVGHGLQPDGTQNVGAEELAEMRSRPITSLQSFARLIASGKPLPKLTWRHETVDGKARLTVTSDPRPKEVRLWTARSDTKEFRTAHWESRSMAAQDGVFVGELPLPEKGCAALLGEAVYEVEGRPMHLSTQVSVVP